MYLKDSPENRKALIQALEATGYGHFEAYKRPSLLAGHSGITMDNGFELDFMMSVPGLDAEDFDVHWNAASISHVDDGVPIRHISYPDLLRNKSATNLAKDRIDVEELRRIHGGEGLSNTPPGA